MMGIVSINDAIILANEVGMTLVEVSPNVNPPVCKILDYGRYKYELQKKLSVSKKANKVVEVKEVKLRLNIEEHDYNVKIRSMMKFFDAGNKVRVTLRFRGREMSHKNLGLQLINKIYRQLEGDVKVEIEPRIEGRQVVMLLGPKDS